MHVHALDHIVLRVADVERSLSWYVDLIGLAPERVEQWRAGEAPFPSVRIDEGTIIDLIPSAPAGADGQPPASIMDHLCLVVDRADVDAILADDRFAVVDGPGFRSGARGEGWSVYVCDPDGNTVELRSYD